MRVEAYIEAIQEQGAALHRAAMAVGPDAAVPGCPGWTVAVLLEHLGLVQRWATSFVRDDRAASFDDLEEKPSFVDPERWFLDGLAELTAALRAAPPDLRCWTFRPAAAPLAFWARRQAHELAIHRSDVDAAASAVTAFDPEFAADGVDELVVTLLGERGGRFRASPPRSLAIRPADAAGALRIEILPDGRRIGPDGGDPADCVIAGRAADLYLFLWNRQPARQPEITGDLRVVEMWRSAVRVVR